jgi:Protein of unknown function (DUF2000)
MSARPRLPPWRSNAQSISLDAAISVPAIAFKTGPDARRRLAALVINADALGNMLFHQDEPALEPTRCAIVVDEVLPPGRAANAAAVVALTLGKRHPRLAGPDLVDGCGGRHPGLIPIGIAVLAAPAQDLPMLRDKALHAGIDVVDFPAQGQETTDYAAFAAQVMRVPRALLSYVAVGVYGPRKAVGRIVGKYRLLP